MHKGDSTRDSIHNVHHTIYIAYSHRAAHLLSKPRWVPRALSQAGHQIRGLAQVGALVGKVGALCDAHHPAQCRALVACFA